MQYQATLVSTEHEAAVTQSDCPRFWRGCRQGVLLALQQAGALEAETCRRVLERWQGQCPEEDG
jgi:hypothetical protein